MSDSNRFQIFCVSVPGLEQVLLEEVREAGFQRAKAETGGVSFGGRWREVWRANLKLRGASRILARFASFHANHLGELDRRARAIDWAAILKPGLPVQVEASCAGSKIYHSGAAAQRVGKAITESIAVPLSEEAGITIKARIENDLCTLSVDTSGGLLHKRGHKQAMAKAPLRETMAALLLRQCGYRGNEPVLDPFCGSGTFLIEAAEIAVGLPPGRNRAFAFEQLATFDAEAWRGMKAAISPVETSVRFHGSDRDAGAIKAAIANAERAGVAACTHFTKASVSDVLAPDGPPGLVIMNPPYGTRIGDKTALRNLHARTGEVLRQRFEGWRIGLLTSDEGLARATGLPFGPRSKPILHGGLRVYLYQAPALS